MGRTIILIKSRHRFVVYFSLAWLAGLVAGVCAATHLSTIHNSLTQSLIESRLSVVGFLASLVLPFVLSAILFRVSLFGLVIPLVFGKAFSYSWCVCVLLICFADAGWLLSRLLVFSDSIVAVLLLWYWFRGLGQDNHHRQVDLLLCIVIALVVGCIDRCVISPFGISLLLHS